ncbi:unnamed protein product [Phyllotreta striolata]|uniref:RRM domain-containing protein n=1 Tax=Phyllotreta striolata TaxID=444603 RepID=A0A9N9TLT5_PHYSR|nr:unnamed protein product [Phyllotreta striolata]
MASGKKGKKTKGKTLALTDFLQETTGSIPVQPIRKSNLNWADEVEDYDDLRKPVNLVLPTAPKASRDYDDISDTVPTEPPFCAYLSNLPYDADEDEIADFFKNMRIANMRIPKDDRGGESKSKGYGYIEFEDRESLLDALVMRETTLKNRRMRIEVASNMDGDRRRGGRMDMNRDRPDRSDGFSDWRSGPRQTESNQDDRDRRGGGGGFNRDRDRDGGGSFTREGMRERNNDENRSFTREGMRDRDYGRDSNRDSFNRRENKEDRDDRPGAWREGERMNKDVDNRDRGGFNRDRGGRFDREDRDERRSFGGRRYDDRDRKDGGGGGGFSRGGGGGGLGGGGPKEDRDSDPPSSEPRERQRLVLAPRTKPVENVPVNTESVPSASIFGKAKPVDTSQREREIEEKLAKEHEKKRDSSKDRDKKQDDRPAEDNDKKNIERSDKSRPPPRKIEDSPPHKETKDAGPPRRNLDDKKAASPKSDQKSPDKSDNRHKIEKSEKPKREDKRERQEKDMPKLVEPEPPNFAANNKFAFLPTEDDNSD